MSAPTDRDRRRTRTELISMTRKLIDNTGRTKFSVNEICEPIGYTRGAFYSSFASMDDHLIAVHERQDADLTDSVVAAVTHAKSDVGNSGDLGKFVNSFVSAIPVDRGRLALRASLMASAQHNPELAEQLTAQRDRLRSALEPYLLGIVSQAGRQLTTDPRTFTDAVMAAQAGAAALLVNPRQSDELRSLLVATTMLGLSRPRDTKPTDTK